MKHFLLGILMLPLFICYSQNVNKAISSGRNDVVYLSPAIEHYEAMPLGNGQLGIMLSNRTGLNFLFNHGAFFSNSNETQDLISSGEFNITLPDFWKNAFIEQRLVLYDGMILTRYVNNKTWLNVRSWLAEGSDALIVEMESNDNLPSISVNLSAIDRKSSQYKPIGLTKDINLLSPSKLDVTESELILTTLGVGEKRGTAMLVKAVNAKAVNLKVHANMVSMDIKPVKKKKISMIIANPVVVGNNLRDNDAIDLARNVQKKIIQSGIQQTRKKQQEYWHNFWSKSSIQMHSEDGLAEYVENLHYLHLFLIAGSARGNEVPKFNGGNYIFKDDWRSWGGVYWYQNTREIYWPLLATGHADLFDSFLEHYLRQLPYSKNFAQTFFNLPGATFPEVSDRLGGRDKEKSAYFGVYHTVGLELAFHFYTYYLYTKDEVFLKDKVYPLLKEVITFIYSLAQKDEKGIYNIYPANSRETYYWVKNAVGDISAVKTTLPILIALSEKYNLDEKERVKWKDFLNNIAPLPVNESKTEYAPCIFMNPTPPTPFKHFEKLYSSDLRSTSPEVSFNAENTSCEAAYPWGLIGLHSDSKEQELAKNTYRNRFFKEWCFENGWDWSVLYAARLGMNDDVVTAFQQFAKYNQFYPSGMCGTPSRRPEEWGSLIGDCPGFDALGVMATAVNEIQLQSYNKLIRVYPAWPKTWEGKFTLHAEGGFEVSSSINKQGQIPSVSITSKFGGECKFANPWKGGAKLLENGKVKSVTKDSIIVFETLKGNSYKILPNAENIAEFVMECKSGNGPKWPFKIGDNDNADSYMKRTNDFGMIGMGKEGSLARQHIKNGVKFISRWPKR